MPDTATLAERLTETAAGRWDEPAAWLIVQHGHWPAELHRNGLLIEDGECVVVDWEETADRLPAMIGTGSEQQVLAIACALATTGSTHLHNVNSLDGNNRRLTLHAIAWAAGGRKWADSLWLIPAPCLCGAEPVHQAGCSGGEA
jgi:hypothetical protein